MSKEENAGFPRSPILRLSIIGVFGALCFVLTAFCGIPYAGGQGYFSFGDIVTLLIAMLVGPIEGAAVGMLGGGFGDLYAGMAVYIPWTLLAKGLMGAATGILFRIWKNPRFLRFFSPFVSSLLMVLTYFFAYWVLYGQVIWINSLFDLVQAWGSTAISLGLYFALRKPTEILLHQKP